MDCSQILPGAVNPGACSLAVGYHNENPFIVYASGKDVVILDGNLNHLQTISGSWCGYDDTIISCVHCAEVVGRVAVAWGKEVVVFEPESSGQSVELNSIDEEGEQLTRTVEPTVHWSVLHTLSVDYHVQSLCWNSDGTRLLAGGKALTMWRYDSPSVSQIIADKEKEISGPKGTWKVVWRCKMALSVVHLKFSTNGVFFATAGENDRLVKIWFPSPQPGMGIGSPAIFSFTYVAHPRPVTGFVWRRTSSSMPRGCVPNVLLTYCQDNVCRLWSHSLPYDQKKCLRFFIAASIDPMADIPFRTTMPIKDLPFIVHWLNNKETTFTNKVNRFQKGSFKPVSHHGSLQSFASSINEEILQSWVCVDDGERGQPSSDPDLGSKQFEMYNFGEYLTPQSVGGRNSGQRTPTRGSTPSVTLDSKSSLRHKRAYAHLMDEWFTSPDLLLCIHPSVGSLMVWTVEGLDAPANSSRLVHVSFSSCLPHIFPPHLAQSLQQNLFQFLIKEPDVVHTRVSESESGSVTDISLPVPQIRLQSRANMAALSQLEGTDDVPKTKPDSTLILVSNHVNGSLNTWSVELTVQSNQCTSIAGLIHCAGTGGHNWVVRSVHRHPWLPVLMTVSAKNEVACSGKRKSSSETDDEAGKEDEDAIKEDTSRGKSEIIIWNADLPGPLEHKSHLNELSRMVALDPHAFRHITWVPPISIGGESNEGAFARCPSSGLFVANVGNELRLFQASLYSITKPQPSSFMQSDFSSSQKAEATSVDASQTADQQDVFVTSQIGNEGIRLVSVIEKDLSKFEEVVCLQAFRMCSLVTSLDIKKSFDSKFCKDIVIVLIENRTPPAGPSTIEGKASSDSFSTSTMSASPSSKRTVSYLHMWRAVICTKSAQPESPISRWRSSKPQSTSAPSLHSQELVTYTASVRKVYSSPLPLPRGTHVIHTSPTCDIASSLQLQLPTLSSPFLFSTTCSDGTIRCWHFSVEEHEDGSTTASPPQPAASSSDPCACDCDDSEQGGLSFRLYEVFESSRPSSSGLLSTSKFLDCCEEDVIKILPTESFIPCAITSAYAGRFAMAHRLTKPFAMPYPRGTLSSSSTKGANPLDRYAVVSVWECESSGGLKWSCEATLMLSTLAGVMTSKANTSAAVNILMEWLPMENGAYLLATCFGMTLSIFGMALPQDEDQFTTPTERSSFLPKQKMTTLSKNTILASWACLLQFNCGHLSMEFPISCLTYTGSNSLIVTIGSEMHLYSCFVKEDQLQNISFMKKEQKLLPKNTSQPFHSRAAVKDRKSNGSVLVNLLDYAHAINTPLPQYHPKILMELMNSSKLHSVKAILVNLVKYLLLYSEKHQTTGGNYFEEGGVDALYESDDLPSNRKMPLLSVSADGYLKRSRKIKPKLVVESIPRLALATMGIFGSKQDSAIRLQEGPDPTDTEDDDYDELFATGTLTDMSEFRYGFEDEDKMELLFSDLDPKKDEFTPEMAQKLSSILHYAQLSDLSDLEQVRLLAIAETVANTKMSFSEQSGAGQGDQQGSSTTAYGANVSLGMTIESTSGAGYASRGLSHGVRGGEAMDDCGLRYLLALENYKTLSESLPDSVSAGSLTPSDFIWAFHSDAELELLSAVPCVQKDELSWAGLRNAGVGWWVRSSETLRKLIEKLARAEFMKRQEPLDASLFYLAMRKQLLLKGLFKTVSDTRMTNFFSNDFTTDRWKKAALKNAFALLGKQRFEQAAAFFLLADKLWDAVEVCVSRLGDLQLAFVITRLYEGDSGPNYERLLKESILGVSRDASSNLKSARLEASFDPFLRSMACWLLQDYSGAMETMLLNPSTAPKHGRRTSLNLVETTTEQSYTKDPAIFNFYFFLRSHPLLRRRDNATRTSFFQAQPHSLTPSRATWSYIKGAPISGVGDEPLTPVERNLLFSTAYYHLCHGCPLLALNVLSKLAKTCDLGNELTVASSSAGNRTGQTGFGSRLSGADGGTGSVLRGTMAGMIQSGTIGDEFSLGGGGSAISAPSMGNTDDDFDWGAPASTQLLSGRQFGGIKEEDEDDIDWSQPFSSRVEMPSDFQLSPPKFSSDSSGSGGEDDGQQTSMQEQGASSTTFSTRGLFILSLAEQLQYNACLSILTEELNTIYVPACCEYLWRTKGKEALPLLPLSKSSKEKDQSIAVHYKENVFDKTLLNLRGTLVEWLREETKVVKTICGFEEEENQEMEEAEESGDSFPPADVPVAYTAPAGYDLLTTLMNYSALHAATSPRLMTVKLELMHLMNTLLPWGTALPPSIQDPSTTTTTTIDVGPTCAVDPAQLPVLTSSSLPVRHLTNLALHLRLMSGSIISSLAKHIFPPIASQPLPHVDKVFELSCAISNCVMVCLSPMKFSEFTSAQTSLQSTLSPTSSTSLTSGLTPVPSGNISDGQAIHDARHSPSKSPFLRKRTDVSGSLSSADFGQPNTKPAKWPGVVKWPNSLTSDEGRDPTPLSVVLVECLVAVYLGLFSTAWSQHSINDISVLLQNAPSSDMWYNSFGGGMDVKKGDEKSRRSIPKGLHQKIETMTKWFKSLRPSSQEAREEEDSVPGIYIAPKSTLLELYLQPPKVKETRDRDVGKGPLFVVGEVSVLEEEEEDGEATDKEDFGDSGESGKGLMFRIGSMVSDPDSETSYNNPDCFAWCLMNLSISKMIQNAVRRILSSAGLEVLELVTCSPLLYSTLKILDEWESILTRRLDALGEPPDDLFGDEDDYDSMRFPAVMRQKLLLEPGNSPFRSKSKPAKQAKQLWEYLVHSDEVRELFIHYIFNNKSQQPGTPLGSLDEEEVETLKPKVPQCRIIHKEHDSEISSFCINSCPRANSIIMAVALPREVSEIEVPNALLLDIAVGDHSGHSSGGGTPKRSLSMGMMTTEEEYVMVPSTNTLQQTMRRPQSQMFMAGNQGRLLSPFGAHAQTGLASSSLLLKRPVFGVKRMAPHPTLSYYLTGSLDGSVTMWEFGTPQNVSVQRSPGTGAAVTKIRFTTEGNKYGVTDKSGKLSLWQGIHTTARTPFHTLQSGMKHLSDFLFLGSSSFIATCGDGHDNKNLYLWDTLLPTKRSIVSEFICHDGGATSLGYSRSKQRLFCGGKKGEVCVFDIRQSALLQSLNVHNSAVNCIAVNDIDGYFVLGAADGDIKILDSSTLSELAYFPGEHAKSRLFRSEGGVTDLEILPGGKLYSCGADGTVKCRTIKM